MTDVKNAPASDGVEPVWDQNQPAWDEPQPRGASGWLRGISGTDRLLYLAVAGVSLLIGLVNALSVAQDVAWRGGAYDLRTPLFWEMSSIVTIILLAPVLFIGVRRVRRASGWPLRIALAAAAIVVFSALHIAGMVGIRKFVVWLAGGSYDFHLSVATVIYEFRKDVVTCLLIGGTLWLIDSRRRDPAGRDRRAARRDGHGTASGLASRWLDPHPHRTQGNHLDQFGRKLRRVQPRRRPQSPGAWNAGGGRVPTRAV